MLPAPRLLGLVREIEAALPASSELVVPSRTVRLPLSWDDPATREAIERYMAGVRDDAPWCPWNIEFIRRINGLESVDEVFDTVFDAEYLVLGLGDVYLGAPVATPLDPRHRLVTTKYNPARTWTPENAVGIGGAYLCIYGMEGPGGYQFVGRTTQVWTRYADSAPFEPGSPWLLRFFDRISWYPVSPEELLDLRADMAAGRRTRRRDRGRHLLPGRTRGLPGREQRVHRGVPGAAGGGLRRRTAGLGRRRRVRPRGRRGRRRPGSRRAGGARRRHPGRRTLRRQRVEGGRHRGRPRGEGPAAGVAGGDEDGNRAGRPVRRRGAAGAAGGRIPGGGRRSPGGPRAPRRNPRTDPSEEELIGQLDNTPLDNKELEEAAV